MNKINVTRLNDSSYFPSSFINDEKLQLLEVSGVSNYSFKELPAEGNFALITNTHSSLSTLSALQKERLRLVIHPNSGHNNFNYEEVKSLNCPIILGNPIRSQAVASYCVNKVLQHYHGTPHHRTWNNDRRYERPLLSQLSVLIIGHGHIGKIIEKSLNAFLMKVIWTDSSKQIDSKNFDIIITACSLTNQTHKMINSEFLNKYAHSKTLFINAARGELVNERDLIKFLSDSPYAYACLDVFNDEPADFSKFHILKNIQHTSHIAGVFKGLTDNIIQFEKSVLSDFMANTASDFNKKYSHLNLKNFDQSKFIGEI